MARLVRVLLVLLAVLGVLVVAADRLAAHAVGAAVGDGLVKASVAAGSGSAGSGGSAGHGGATPGAEVDFRGIPFLTQALAGRYDTVDVVLTALPAGRGLVLDRVEATLQGVAASPAAALSGGLRTLPVESGTARVTETFTTLQSSAGAVGGAQVRSIRFSRAAADRIAVDASVLTLTGPAHVTGEARVWVEGGAVHARLLQDTVRGVPVEYRSLVASTDLDRAVPPLPYGFRATTVTVGDDGLHVVASGRNLSIPL